MSKAEGWGKDETPTPPLSDAELVKRLEALAADFSQLHSDSPTAAFLRLAASRLSVPREGEWLPIETAPTDGTRILVIVADADLPEPVIAWWCPEIDDSPHKWSCTPREMVAGKLVADATCYSVPSATHWQPLPKSPA